MQSTDMSVICRHLFALGWIFGEPQGWFLDSCTHLGSIICSSCVLLIIVAEHLTSKSYSGQHSTAFQRRFQFFVLTAGCFVTTSAIFTWHLHVTENLSQISWSSLWVGIFCSSSLGCSVTAMQPFNEFVYCRL